MPQHRQTCDPVYNGQEKDITQVRVQSSLHRHYLLRRYGRQMHFFPMLLPLVEIVPLLLAAVGGLATLAGGLWHRRRRVLMAAVFLALVCFMAAGAFVYNRTPDKVVRFEGTKEIAAADYAVVSHFAALSPVKMPQDIPVFDEVFSTAVKNPLLATPVISNGVLVTGSYHNSANGFDIATGEWLWSLPQAEPVFTIGKNGKGAGNIVYIGEGLHHTRAAMLTAMEMPSAKIIWQRQFLGHIESPPAHSADGETIYVPTGAGGIWALRAADGGVVFHADVGHTDATPLVRGDKIYLAAQPDENIPQSIFYALDAATGSIEWQVALQGQPWGAPVISADGTKIITTTGRGQIGVKRDTDTGWAMALSPVDGKIIWQRSLANMAIDAGDYLPAADMALFTLKNGEIIALQGATGDVIWQAKVATEFMAPAVFVHREAEKNTLVAATSADGVFTLRDAATGKELRRRPVAAGSSASPVVQGDRIYVTVPYRIHVFGGLSSL